VSASTDSLLRPSVMRPADLDEVMIVENRNYDFPWTAGIFKDCIKAGYTCQVLRLQNQLVGYGVLQVGADEGHILNLCIDSDFNRRGYARYLLTRLVNLAERQGARMMFLEVRPSNPRAIQMYLLAGFNEVGMRKAYYDSFAGREDAIVMAKSI